MQKNAAKYGYTVRGRADIRNSEHYVAGVSDTRETMKWLFGAKENEVSPLYECGDNDHLLVVVLTKINKEGYRQLDDESVKSYVEGTVVIVTKRPKCLWLRPRV